MVDKPVCCSLRSTVRPFTAGAVTPLVAFLRWPILVHFYGQMVSHWNLVTSASKVSWETSWLVFEDCVQDKSKFP